jgi:hypothetical protein
MRKPLETRLLTFDRIGKLGSAHEKAQFTTKLHFFALYQQKPNLETRLKQFFTMKSKT